MANFFEDISQKKKLITGIGAGAFIGTHLVQYFLPGYLSEISRHLFTYGYELIYGSIGWTDSITAITARSHFASMVYNNAIPIATTSCALVSTVVPDTVRAVSLLCRSKETSVREKDDSKRDENAERRLIPYQPPHTYSSSAPIVEDLDGELITPLSPSPAPSLLMRCFNAILPNGQFGMVCSTGVSNDGGPPALLFQGPGSQSSTSCGCPHTSPSGSSIADAITALSSQPNIDATLTHETADGAKTTLTIKRGAYL